MPRDWLDLTKQAFEASSAWLETNYRSDWDYSLRAFRNEHALNSKYLSNEYQARSRIFPPYTRSIIRKNEAAGAAALFANMETANFDALDQSDPYKVASSQAMKYVIEYRLQHSIPWFQTVMGAIQDAQAQGAVVSYNYWDYQVRDGRKIKDKPCIQLRPIENIRLDGGADWTDPVGTSPYFCDIIPMYVCDVRGMMASKGADGKPSWKKYDDDVILKARPDVIDTLRQARLGKKTDPAFDDVVVKDFDVVWVMRWFMKDHLGDDYTYYSLSTEELLSDPVPVEKTYFHGMRPYTMGYAVLETHKALKTSLPMLIKPLQQESAEIRNQRLDNVKFVLNKRWLVARGRQVDVQSLVRNVPGGVTLTTDPKNDIVESNWPDVTSSAYVEQDRLKSDLDELAGNFSPSTKVANNAVNDTLGGSRMASMGAGMMTDYMLRTVIETWMEPTLRHLVKLEAEYETDDIVLSVAAKKAKLFPKYGLSQITDDMLKNETIVTVNVGMGSSNPNERFQKLIAGTRAVMETLQVAPPNFNRNEFIKEAFSNMGYRDGSRFWNDQVDPMTAHLMQMVQQLQGALKGKQMEMQAEAQLEQMRLQSQERIKGAEIQVNQGRIQGELQVKQADIQIQQAGLIIEQQRLELEKVKLQIESHNADLDREMKFTELNSSMAEAQMKMRSENQKLAGQAVKIAADIEKAKLDLQKARTAEEAARVQAEMQNVSGEIDSVRQALDQSGKHMEGIVGEVKRISDGVTSLAQTVAKPARSPRTLTLKKDGGKTTGVGVEYNDGSREEIGVK